MAVAIGTTHGLYKRKTQNESLRFDILEQIIKQIPKTPLVLHGASTIPEQYIKNINKFGGEIKNAYGISPVQIRKAIALHITKVKHIDSYKKFHNKELKKVKKETLEYIPLF